MRAQSRKGEAHLFTLHCLELNIRTPGREFTEGLGHFRSAKGKDGTWTEYTFRSAVNRITRVWKPKRKVNTLTLWVVARDWSENMEAGALRTMFQNYSCQSANEEAQKNMTLFAGSPVCLFTFVNLQTLIFSVACLHVIIHKSAITLWYRDVLFSLKG